MLAQRDGIWDLHLIPFRSMIPLFMTYGHQNYSRWGPGVLSRHAIPPQQVKEEFNNGDFVVKRSSSTFSQVDTDHSQEWMNGTGKSGVALLA